MTIRTVIFLIGLAFMFVALFVPFIVTDERVNRFRLFDLGLLMAVGAHGWPENLH